MRPTIDGLGGEQERLKFDDLLRYLERHTFEIENWRDLLLSGLGR